MAYPDDLLQFAQELANLYPDEAHQPSLRRALSTGYYALFYAAKQRAQAEREAALLSHDQHPPTPRNPRGTVSSSCVANSGNAGAATGEADVEA